MHAPRKNRSIAELERWTADPAGLARLEALVLVCQRAPFVKSVLGLTDSTERIRRHIRIVCDRHGIECRVGHGPGYDGFHLREANIHKRYACSLLLGWLLASSHGGIRQTEDGLAPDNLLDRMLYCYRRYLDLFMVPAARADVSFEMFYTLYQAYTVEDVSLLGCENCGSRFVMLRTAHLPICPICAVHHHAQMPVQYRAGMEAKSAVAHQASG
jgi:hypothetical protein